MWLDRPLSLSKIVKILNCYVFFLRKLIYFQNSSSLLPQICKKNWIHNLLDQEAIYQSCLLYYSFDIKLIDNKAPCVFFSSCLFLACFDSQICYFDFKTLSGDLGYSCSKYCSIILNDIDGILIYSTPLLSSDK